MQPNELKRSVMMNRAVQDENQKFDNQKSRMSWVGGLRSNDFMYLTTTKNNQNALYCHIKTNSRNDPAYNTTSSNTNAINCWHPDILSASLTVDSQIDVPLSSPPATEMNFLNRLGDGKPDGAPGLRNQPGDHKKSVAQVGSDEYNSLFTNPGRNYPLRKKTTKIFDGDLIESARNSLPRRTFKSKKNSVADG